MPEQEQHQAIPRGLIARTQAALQAFSEQQQLGEGELVPYLERKIQEGASIRQLSASVSLPPRTLARFLRTNGVILPTAAEVIKHLWQNPEFRDSHIEGSKQNLERSKKDPNFHQKYLEAMHRIWQDPEYRASQSERARQTLERSRQNPDFRQRQAEAARQLHQDPNFRAIQLEALRRVWQDPDYRRRHAEANRRMLGERWQDPEFRRRQAEAARRARLNSANQDHYILPTIFGQRRDLPNFSQSAWESNVERVIILCGRDFLAQEVFRLTVPNDFQELLADPSDFALDFLTLDRRSNFVGYEIMAHPLENPIGWLKAELFTQQYPEIRLVLITRRFYERLRRRFATRINNHPDLIGWETSKDNLGNNPTKWTAPQQ